MKGEPWFDEVDIDNLDLDEPVQVKSKLSRLRRAPAKRQDTEAEETPPAQTLPPASIPSSASREQSQPTSSHSLHSGASKLEDGPNPENSTSTGNADQANNEGEHWNEEDELEEDMRRALSGQEQGSQPAGSSESSRESSQAAGSRKDDDSSSGDSQELYAGMQMALQDTASQDRIGHGQKAEIQPLSGVLQKLLQRRQMAVSRIAQPHGTAPAARASSPPAAQPQPTGSRDSQDMVLLSDDEGSPTEAAMDRRQVGELPQSKPDGRHPWQAHASLAHAEPAVQAAGNESQDLAANAAQAGGAFGGDSLLLGPSLHLGLDSETQGWMGSQAFPPLEGTETEQGECPASSGAPQPAGAAHLESTAPFTSLAAVANPLTAAGGSTSAAQQPQQQQQQQQAAAGTVQAEACVVDMPDEVEPSVDDGEEEDGELHQVEELDGSEELQEGSRSRHSSEAAAEKDESASEEEEEEEASDSASGSDSSNEEEEEMSEEARRAAMKQALRDARTALRDRPRKKGRSTFFEEEAELSDDEEGAQHADSADDDEEDDQDHRALLTELIGHEKDGKRDESKRAKLHAQWQEAQDEEAVQRLLKGIQHGFKTRSRHAGALDVEEGNNYDARLRRAAMAQQEGEDSVAESGASDDEHSDSRRDSDSEDDHRRPMDMDAIEQMSDDEAKAELKAYHQHQLMEAAHEEAAKELQLLDGDAMQVLGMFARGAKQHAPSQEHAQQARGKTASGAFAVDITNRSRLAQSKHGSFVGLRNNVAAGSSRSAWQHSNARSYVFGSAADSNPATAPEKEQQQDRAPTSFAGLHQMVRGAAGLEDSPASQGLLDLLGGKAGIGMAELSAARGTSHSDLPVPDVLAHLQARAARRRA